LCLAVPGCLRRKSFALTYTNGTADPATYYYVLNLQGDVVKLVEHVRNGRVYTLNTVAEYTYDAWGKPLSTTDGEGNSVANTHIAKLNPLRYRGYYFDMETGFYYLQSRYYDPTLRRFINADSYQSTGQGILGTNMFAYCNNSPVGYMDPAGMRFVDADTRYYGNGLYAYTDAKTGNEYSTALKAAIAAGYLLNKLTQEDNLEHACGIYYRKSTNKYYIGSLITGAHNGVDVTPIIESENDVLVAIVHSHPLCTGHQADFFSFEEDGKLSGDAAVVYYNRYPLYLASPRGNLRLLIYTDYYGFEEFLWENALPEDDTVYDCRAY